MSEQIQTASMPESSVPAMPPVAGSAVKGEHQVFQTSSKLRTALPHEGNTDGGNVEFGVLRQVPMTVQVEVGRTSMTLGEVLDELEVGSSIRLDRHAGDPVEVYINGALFARAEVVVLQDQIGARIVELVDPAQNSRPSVVAQPAIPPSLPRSQRAR
jgi:flagellar motor switch protein FliN/FliY